MTFASRSLTLIAALSMATPLWAQDTPAETPAETQAEDAAPAADAAAPAAPAQSNSYERETNGDWTVLCERVSDTQEICNMQQLLTDSQDNPVAEITILAFGEGAPAPAGARLATPLDTLLSEGVRISIDGGEARSYPFTFCRPDACYAQFPLSAADVAAYKAGGSGTITIVPLAAPDQRAGLELSLSGFTASFDTIESLAPAPQ